MESLDKIMSERVDIKRELATLKDKNKEKKEGFIPALDLDDIPLGELGSKMSKVVEIDRDLERRRELELLLVNLKDKREEVRKEVGAIDTLKAERKLRLDTHKVLKEIEVLEELEDKYLTERVREMKSEKGGTIKSRMVERCGENLKQIERRRNKIKNLAPQAFAMASLLYTEEELSSGFVNTNSRKEDYMWLLERSLTGRPILFQGPTGTGKTHYVRHLSRSLIGEDPVIVSGNEQMRVSDLEGKEGLRKSKEGNATETYEVLGAYGKAIEQAERCGRSFLLFDEFDFAPQGVRIWLKAKFGEEMKKHNVTLIATANLTGGARHPLDDAERREFSGNVRKIDYMPKEEMLPIYLAKLMEGNNRGEVRGEYDEVKKTIKAYAEKVEEVQKAYSAERKEDKKLLKNVIDVGSAIALLDGYLYSNLSLHSFISKRIEEYIKNLPNREAKDIEDRNFIANKFAEYFDIPSAPNNSAKANKTKEASKGYISLQSLSAISFVESGVEEQGLGVEDMLGNRPFEDKISSLEFNKLFSNQKEHFKSLGIDPGPKFQERMQDIWGRNKAKIEQEIKENGYDYALFIPKGFAGSDPTAFATKIAQTYTPQKVYKGDNYEKSTITSQGNDRDQIILVHKVENTQNHPILNETRGKSITGLKYNHATNEAEIILSTKTHKIQGLSLEQYWLFDSLYHKETGKHLDNSSSATWTPQTRASQKGNKGIVGFVHSDWGDGVGLYAFEPSYADSCIALRPSRCVF